MRNAFAKSITKLANKNKQLVLLSGDIGNRLFDEYKKKFPKRFYNCGIAEQNMVGLAAGLAIEGFIPVLYTITPFLTSRAFEQIRLDICYPKLKVIIVGTGAGLSYSRLGPTHHSLEDLALMQSLPNLNVFCPGDSYELDNLLPNLIKNKNPSYIRLGKKGEPLVNKKNKLKLGVPNFIFKGREILILSLGNMLSIAFELGKYLKQKGYSPSVVSVHTLKPFNLILYKKILKKYKKIIFIEEHYFHGGLAQKIKSNYDTLNLEKKKIISFSVPFDFHTGLGEQSEARDILGINLDKICKKLLRKKFLE